MEEPISETQQPDASGEQESSLLEAAVESTPESTEETSSTPDESGAEATDNETETTVDEDIAWLKNKGIDPTSPDAIKKLAQISRNTEHEYHQSRQTASELRKQMETTTADPELFTDEQMRIMRLESKVAVSDFYIANPEARTYDAEMAAIVKDKPFLAQDLETLLVLAKAQRAETDRKAEYERGVAETKKATAKASAGSVPSGQANAPQGKAKDPIMDILMADD